MLADALRAASFCRGDNPGGMLHTGSIAPLFHKEYA